MSLSNPSKKNPASKYIEWKGSVGKFYYYDKESEQNVFYEKSMFIVVLDELSTIKGFHKQSESSVFSNEVRHLKDEILNVRSFKGGDIAKGIYSDIKGNLQGGKFAKSLYCALISGDKKAFNLELVNISFVGSSLGSLIDAQIKTDDGIVIELSPSADKLKNGNTVYFAPKIKKTKVRKDILESCVNLDIELQSYLKTYFSTLVIKNVENEVKQKNDEFSNSGFEDVDDLPF